MAELSQNGGRIKSSQPTGQQGNPQPYYILYCKCGYFELAQDGTILYDSNRNYHSTSGHWKVLGFATRYNSSSYVTLQAAANGVPIGQGWVYDIDHGTHRMWASPSHLRAISVSRISTSSPQESK